MDWPAIHAYAEGVELWSSLAINFWLFVTGVIYLARRTGLVKGIPETIGDALVEGAYFASWLLAVILLTIFSLTGDWIIIGLDLVVIVAFIVFSIRGDTLMIFTKKQQRRRK